jgi:hypothetical protein
MVNNQKIELDINWERTVLYCIFNLKNELILYNCISYDNYTKEYKTIIIYSTQTKDNKWNCKRIYKIPENFELINISEYDKLYLFSNQSIYEFNLITEKSIKILFIEEELEFAYSTYTIKLISSNEKSACLKINDKIIIYSAELEIPIVSLDINNGNFFFFLK